MDTTTGTEPDRNAHSNFEGASTEPVLKPTKETYDPLQHAYERLNAALFEGVLPNCLITLQRRGKKVYGYFASARFELQDGRTTDEIALNPTHFRELETEEVLATLAHEMTHLWQVHFGKPGRGRDHNREWAEKMKVIGLQPTDTGKEGGQETGERVFHMIVEGGAFDKAVRRLISRGFAIAWTERIEREKESEQEKGGRESKSGKRVKYLCTHEGCKVSMQGRSDLEPLCQGHPKSGKHAPALMVLAA